ncbi:hypothetical protein [Achromobacter piechaudii]|uniref:Uncharacterized protein n=1 Tax=Achromobacter piechaudii TaxID=72556 RepID=A0A6S7BTF0_9BURK|nr:hypothetical protein [Achromobacter piechaudii]CAB3817440.1 hypothetical protein LMG1861_00071 [Achromobacter piechaudii]
MANHEKSYLQHFGDHLRDQANQRGANFERFDLDGQDYKVLADLIFTNYDYFVLVEGKNSEMELGTERRKAERVSRLCSGLAANPAMLALHDACHFIAWRNSKSTKLELDVYRKQICTTAMLGTACPLPPPDSSTAEPFKLRKFSDGFFHMPPPPTFAIHRADFEEYVRWLVTTVTAGDSSEVELVGRKYDADGDAMAIALPSLALVYELLDEHRNNLQRSSGMDGP